MKIAALALCASLAMPAAAQQLPTTMPQVHRPGALLVPGLPSMRVLPISSHESSTAPGSQPFPPLVPPEEDAHLLVPVLPVAVVDWGGAGEVPLRTPSEPHPTESALGEARSASLEEPDGRERLALERELALLERSLAASRRALEALDRRIETMTQNARQGVATYEGVDGLANLTNRRNELAVAHEADRRRFEQLLRLLEH